MSVLYFILSWKSFFTHVNEPFRGAVQEKDILCMLKYAHVLKPYPNLDIDPTTTSHITLHVGQILCNVESKFFTHESYCLVFKKNKNPIQTIKL